VEAKIEKFDEVLGFLEGYLSKSAFFAGDKMTIAGKPFPSTTHNQHRLPHRRKEHPQK